MSDATKNIDKRRVGGTCNAEVDGIQAVGPRDVILVTGHSQSVDKQ